MLGRYRGKLAAADTEHYLKGSMKPGKLENLLCSFLFQDYCQNWFDFVGVFWIFFFFHLVFIVLQLWLPLLTDKSILPLLGKVVLWKSAKSGMGFQTKGALEPVWFLSSWKSVLMQAQTRRTRGSAGSRCWYMLSGWAWSCVDRQSKPAARGQRKDWDHHSFILRSFYVSLYCPAPQPRMKEGPEHPKWLICWKAPRCICSPSPHQDGWTKKED